MNIVKMTGFTSGIFIKNSKTMNKAKFINSVMNERSPFLPPSPIIRIASNIARTTKLFIASPAFS